METSRREGREGEAILANVAGSKGDALPVMEGDRSIQLRTCPKRQAGATCCRDMREMVTGDPTSPDFFPLAAHENVIHGTCALKRISMAQGGIWRGSPGYTYS